MKVVRLREGKDTLRRHPWVFEGSVDKGGADYRRDGAGAGTRRAVSRLGFVQPALGRSACAPGSFDEAERIDAALFARRLCGRRWTLRARLADAPATRCAWCTARRTESRAWWSTATGTTSLGAVPGPRRQRALDASRSPTRCYAATGLHSRCTSAATPGVRDARGARASRAGWLRGERRHRASWCVSTSWSHGRSTWRRGTRPARTSTSATTAAASRECGAPASAVPTGAELPTATAAASRVAALAGGARRVVTGVDSSAAALERWRGATWRDNGVAEPPGRLRGGRRQPDCLRACRVSGRRILRRHRARPAKVRADRRACRARRARLQGHQPAGAQAAAPGWAVVHVLVLGRRRRRAVPQDRGRRGPSMPA